MSIDKKIVRQARVVSIDDDNDYRTGVVEVMGKQTEVLIHGTYGHAYNPPENSTGTLLASAGGDATKYFFPDQPNQRYRGLGPGEVQTGNYEGGNSIKYDSDGNITISTMGSTVVVSRNGNITITPSGDVIVENADVIVNGGDVIADGISLKTHVHGGVEAGGATTGAPE